VQKTPAIAMLLCIAPFASGPVWALDPHKAMYVGGTVSSLPPGRVEGSLDFSGAAAMSFIAAKDGSSVSVQWKSIQDLEYGPQVPPRWKAAKSLKSLPSFMSKKSRKHYITIGYKDFAGADQAVVFELGDQIIRRTLTALKDKSGKPLTCQDELTGKELGDICSSVLPPPEPEPGKEPEKKPEKN
jgi:hypothetical protein